MNHGINYLLLAVQLINIVLIILWIMLAFRAFRRIGTLQLSDGQKLGWAALIILVPMLGAAALLLTYPAPSSRGLR